MQGESARREDGTAHGFLLAIVKHGLGWMEETFCWALEENPVHSPGKITPEEPAKRAVVGARIMGLMPPKSGHNAEFFHELISREPTCSKGTDDS